LGTVKPKLDQIERLDEHIDRADGIIPILKALRQQGRLPAIHPFNEPRHPSPRWEAEHEMACHETCREVDLPPSAALPTASSTVKQTVKSEIRDWILQS
jgi:hypothetical protein